MTDDLIEKMARAHFLDFYNLQAQPETWDNMPQAIKLRRVNAMRAAWAVAAEATDAMGRAGYDTVAKVWCHVPVVKLRDIWQAMHGAADGGKG